MLDVLVEAMQKLEDEDACLVVEIADGFKSTVGNACIVAAHGTQYVVSVRELEDDEHVSTDGELPRSVTDLIHHRSV